MASSEGTGFSSLNVTRGALPFYVRASSTPQLQACPEAAASLTLAR